MITHTKEPWKVVSDTPVMAIYSESENYRVVQTINQNNCSTYGKSRGDVGIYKQADAERIVACVNACKGITTEVLNKGVLEDAIALVLNAGKDIGVTWDGKTPYYEGVKVWEEK